MILVDKENNEYALATSSGIVIITLKRNNNQSDPFDFS